MQKTPRRAIHHVDGLGADSLTASIKEVEEALAIAVDELNSHIEAMSRNSLAYFYAQRYEETKKHEDLKQALYHCKALDHRYGKSQKHEYGAFLDTYAFVLSQSIERTDLQRANEYADQAIVALDKNHYAYETKARILKKMSDLGFV